MTTWAWCWAQQHQPKPWASAQKGHQRANGATCVHVHTTYEKYEYLGDFPFSDSICDGLNRRTEEVPPSWYQIIRRVAHYRNWTLWQGLWLSLQWESWRVMCKADEMMLRKRRYVDRNWLMKTLILSTGACVTVLLPLECLLLRALFYVELI